MRISVRAMTIAGGLVWGGYAMFGTGMLNLLWPPYGEHFLITMSSVYPGYQPVPTVGEVLVATVYGLADGAGAGFLLAVIYNFFTPAVATNGQAVRATE